MAETMPIYLPLIQWNNFLTDCVTYIWLIKQLFTVCVSVTETNQEVSFNAAGQVIGQVKQVESVKDVIYRMVNEYLDSIDRLNSLLPED